MMERLRMHVGIAIGVAISLLALALALRWSGLEPLRYALLEIDYRYLGLAIMIFLASMVARAFCWRTLLGSSLSLWRVLAALNQGYLLNNVLPWRMGEIGRAILLGRRPGMTVPGVLSSIMVERLYDIILALSLFLGLLPLAIGLPGVLQSATLGSVVLVVALISLLVVLIKPEFVERVLLKLPGGSRIWQPFWLRFGEGLKSLRNPRVVMVSLGWLLLSWILAGIEYWLVLKALIPEADLVWAFFMLTITLLGVAIPSSPGYIGVFEVAGISALSVFGVPRGQALAATLVLHAMVYIIGSGLGALALAGEGETLRSLYTEMRSWLASISTQQAG